MAICPVLAESLGYAGMRVRSAHYSNNLPLGGVGAPCAHRCCFAVHGSDFLNSFAKIRIFSDMAKFILLKNVNITASVPAPYAVFAAPPRAT